MKFCIRCGNKLEDDQMFCANCGTKKSSLMNTNNQNEPEVNRVQHVRSNQLPPQDYSYQRNQQVQSAVHSKFVDTNEYQNFKKSITVFTLIPIFSIIGNLVIEDTYISIIISALITLFGFSIFAIGIISFKQLGNINSKKEITRSIYFFIIYAILNPISNLTFTLLPDLSYSSSLAEVQNYVESGLILVIFVFIVTFILLIGTISFNTWFNEFSFVNRLQMTSRIKWIGILTVLGNGFLVLAMGILHQAAFSIETSSSSSVNKMIDNSQVFLGIGSIILLASYIMHILAGYKIYQILNELENRVRYQQFGSRQGYQDY